MDHDDTDPLQRRSLDVPLGSRRLPALLKVLTPPRVVRRVGRIDQDEAGTESFRDDRNVARVEGYVRVAERMDVAHGAVHRRRHFEQVHERRRFEVPGAAGLDLRVTRILQQHRHPANLEIRSSGHDQIRRACTRYETRLCIDSVYVLERAGRRVDVDLVAAQVRDQRSPVRRRRKNLERRLRRQ